MPKKRTVLTAKEQILIALIYRKLEDSPSTIEKILGFKRQQLNCELFETTGLIKEGLIQKNKGVLFLTDKGKRDPLIATLISTRKIGMISLIVSLGMLLHMIVGLALGYVNMNQIYYLNAQGGLIIFSFTIG